jgi:GcrA cell cycle regulator
MAFGRQFSTSNIASGPAHGGGNWTDERVAVLKKLWAEGLSASVIAAELGGVTRNGVIGKIHRLGLAGRVKNPSAASSRLHTRQAPPPRMLSRFTMLSGAMMSVQFSPAPAITPASESAPLEEISDLSFADRKTLFELTPRSCRWPVGNPCEADFFFCGSETAEGESYCAYHGRVAHVPTAKLKDRSLDYLAAKWSK